MDGWVPTDLPVNFVEFRQQFRPLNGATYEEHALDGMDS